METKNKGGRPSFKVTPAMRKKVSIAAGGGMTHNEIATGLGISVPTLEKHFREELSVGAYSRRLDVLEAMYKAARGGNVAAQKAYSAFSPASTAQPLPAVDGEKPKGKKDQAQADAQGAQAGTDWADLLPSHGNVTPIRSAG